MARPTLSVLGLYTADNTLFDNMVVPTGIDKELVTDNILLECAEFETIYPAIPFLKVAIGRWSEKELPVWTKLYETTQFDYNPIYNKDATYTDTDTETRNLHGSSRGSSSGNTRTSSDVTNTETHNLTNKLTNDLKKDRTDETDVAAYDSNTLTHREKITINDDDSGTATTTDTGTLTTTNNAVGGTSDNVQTSGTTTDTGTVIHQITRREYGNIGVTTTQQMIEAERDVVRFNVINEIVESFKMRFCILVY